jgi:hypothetical protein
MPVPDTEAELRATVDPLTAGHDMVSGRRESHPPALSELSMSLSTHSAPIDRHRDWPCLANLLPVGLWQQVFVERPILAAAGHPTRRLLAVDRAMC